MTSPNKSPPSALSVLIPHAIPIPSPLRLPCNSSTILAAKVTLGWQFRLLTERIAMSIDANRVSNLCWATFAYMRQRLVRVIVGLVALAALAGCTYSRTIHSQSGAATNAISQPLPNGIYAVLKQAATPTSTPGEGSSHIVLVYDRRKYGEAPENEPLTYVTVDRNAFVPLIVEGTPNLQKDDAGKSVLRISLARDQVKELEDFTRAHLGERVATVLDGEIITLNKIRSVIVGGEVQMTRCSDDACKIVRAKLAK